MNPKRRACFVNFFAHPRLEGEALREPGAHFVGGAELQQYFRAEWLRRRGWQVHWLMPTWNRSLLPERERKAYAWHYHDGHPAAIADAMRETGCRVFLGSSPAPRLLSVAWHCYREGAAFVYRIASNLELTAFLPRPARAGLSPRWRGQNRTARKQFGWQGWSGDARGIQFSLASADRLLVQTRLQQGMVRAYWGRSSFLLPNAWPVGLVPPVGVPEDGPVLWVGNFSPAKRPEWMLRVARENPRVRFLAIGTVNPGEPWEWWRRELARHANVSWLGAAPLTRTQACFRRARMLLVTSRTEGFPNTFLQAWEARIPIVSTVDPEGVLGRSGSGIGAKSVGGLSRAVKDLWGDRGRADALGERGHRWLLRHHDPDRILPAYEKMLEELSEERNAGPLN